MKPRAPPPSDVVQTSLGAARRTGKQALGTRLRAIKPTVDKEADLGVRAFVVSQRPAVIWGNALRLWTTLRVAQRPLCGRVVVRVWRAVAPEDSPWHSVRRADHPILGVKRRAQDDIGASVASIQSIVHTRSLPCSSYPAKLRAFQHSVKYTHVAPACKVLARNIEAVIMCSAASR
ncbi:hypothetical protein VFPBJ_06638 [Purpureocillium lilacinum]|uniref:Uncharacterized protein n=1 Tax=Purpureocillium lilacinum TaxID=33203 RepID=A0A179GKV1_PURLI|nr:hypothetical protein VFPBJ_06638 [Purpureocillium lilacinum]